MKKVSQMIANAIAKAVKNVDSHKSPVAILNPEVALEQSIIVPTKMLEVLMKRAFKDHTTGDFETAEYRRRRVVALLAEAKEHEDITEVMEDDITIHQLSMFITHYGQE